MQQRLALGTSTLLLAGALLAPVPPAGAEEAAARTLAEVAWISGGWRGEAFGGEVEEWWTPPSGGMMQGAFRLFRGDATSMFEFLMIRQLEDGVELRFKHYAPDMTPREEVPLRFRLVDSGPGRAVFESDVQDEPRRMTYSLEEDGELVVRVENRRADGTLEGFDVRMRRFDG